MKTITLSTVDNAFQANLLQEALRNEGIESYLKNETIASVLPTTGFLMEVQVYENDYEKAKEILKKGFPELA